MPTIAAKDLAHDIPRSPYTELAGFPWLPRLIDKVRALHAGTLGGYTPYPCGGDRHFLLTVGVDADALKALIAGAATDPAIGEWVQAHAAAGYEVRLQAYRADQRSPSEGEYVQWLDQAKAELAKERPSLDLSGVTNFSQLICVEEGHPIPAA